MSGTTTLGSATLDASGVATLTPNLTGGVNYNIIANYSGDVDHLPSSSPAIAVSGTPTLFTLGVSPAGVTMATSQNATVTVNLTSNGSFTDTIGLGCASLPAGVFCHFSNASVKLTPGLSASVQLTIDTNNPLGGGSSAMNRPAGGSKISLAGLFLPLSALFGFVFWRLRKRSAGILHHGHGPGAFSGRAPGHWLQQLLHQHSHARQLRHSGNRNGRNQRRPAVSKRFAHHHEIDPEAFNAERAREKDELLA